VLKNDLKIGNSRIIIPVTKGTTALSFKIILNTKCRFVSGATLNPISITLAGSVFDPGTSKVKFDINKVHEVPGYL
jgi:hypothetical protein